MKTKIRLLFIFIYSFILLYQPDFSPWIKLNNFILCGIFTAIYLLINISYKDKNIIKSLKKKPFLIFIIMQIAATVYFALRTIVAGTSITDILGLRIVQGLIPIMYLIGALIVNNELNQLGYDRKQKYNFIISLALCQGLIALLMYFVPSIKVISKTIFMNGWVTEINTLYILQNRLHGLCDGDYTYGLQIMHSILALFAIAYAVSYKDKKAFIKAIIIFMVTLLNGRFGIIVFAIGFLFLLIDYIINSKNLVNAIKIITITLIIGISMVFFLKNFMPNTYSLVREAFLDVNRYTDGTSGNTETSHWLSMFIWPAGLSIIIGCGHRVLGEKGLPYGFTKSSDVGYVNDMFMGGIVYMFLLYYGYYYIVRNILKKIDKKCFERKAVLIVTLGMLLANLKGEALRSAILTSSFIFIITILLISTNYELDEKKK